MLRRGDQIAESPPNVGKRGLRRCKRELRQYNLVLNDSSDTIDHRNLLAAHYLNKKPGSERVLIEDPRDLSRGVRTMRDAA